MSEEAIQNLEQKLNPNLYSLCIDTGTDVVKKANVPGHAEYFTPEACCSTKKTYWYSAWFQKCPFPRSSGFRFQFQVDESLKDFSISYSTMERSGALKNERNREENFETITFARNQENRTGKNKKRRIKESICLGRITFDFSSWTPVYSAPDTLEVSIVSIVIIFK